MTRSANLESTDDEHQVVLDAIVAGDEDTARRALREHSERGCGFAAREQKDEL